MPRNSSLRMIVENCEFPDDLLYDYDGNTWVRISPRGPEAIVGVTRLLTGIAGRLSRVNVRAVSTMITRGRSLGTIESTRMVGPIPSPLSGQIIQTNDLLKASPRILNNDPYGEGWIARLNLSNFETEKEELSTARGMGESLLKRITEFHVRCFKLFPDHEMVEVGSECAAVLVRLNELIEKAPVGDVIHIVSDDPTSYVDIVAWSDRTRNELVEWRREDALYHFIVRK
ncbi:MAG TPA: sulfurtransferase TusA family protein, partial [Candidatus Binatus sp.]|nr:sulfurtransferase TusA family protein [Candidatus Binatus sp.]